jgi:hypothetical protein
VRLALVNMHALDRLLLERFGGGVGCGLALELHDWESCSLPVYQVDKVSRGPATTAGVLPFAYSAPTTCQSQKRKVRSGDIKRRLTSLTSLTSLKRKAWAKLRV